MVVKLGLIRLLQRLRRDKLALFGFELALFSQIAQFDFFSYSFVDTVHTFIWAFWKLALIGFVLGSFFPLPPSVSFSYSLVIIVLTFI